MQDIINSLNLDLHKSTLQRFLHLHGFAVKAPKKKIVLTPTHKQNRIDYCKKYINTDFSEVAFSDEKKFSLDGPDCYYKTWQHPSDQVVVTDRKPFKTGAIMVHVTVLSTGVVSMNEILGNLDSEGYCKLIKNEVLPLIQLYKGERERMN